MNKQILIGIIGCVSFSTLCAVTLPLQETNIVTLQTHDDKELSWVDEQIQAILPSRIGVPEGTISSLKDPMKMKKPVYVATQGSKLLAPPKLGSSGLVLPPKIVEEPLRLQALINKSALINKKWYKLNDVIRNYTLTDIKSNSVLLRGKKDQQLILFLTKSNSNIQITTK